MPPADVVLLDLHPPVASFRDEVLAGLRRSPKTLPCKWFYDARGAELYERIVRTSEYYPPAAETEILATRSAELRAWLGPGGRIVEPGSGSGEKTRSLLRSLEAPAEYVPVDLSRDQLLEASRRLASEFPRLRVRPVCADFTRPLGLPAPGEDVRRTVVFFPGSTIGNFDRTEAVRLLGTLGAAAGPGGGLIVGADLKKDPSVLHAAYNDADGATAAFNRNLLERINRELEGTFDAGRFRHYAFYSPVRGRVEMHLVSVGRQRVRVAGEEVEFADGETVHTENSYKYTLPEFRAIAGDAGLRSVRAWTDAEGRFSVHLIES